MQFWEHQDSRVRRDIVHLLGRKTFGGARNLITAILLLFIVLTYIESLKQI